MKRIFERGGVARDTIAIFAGDGVQRTMDLVFLLLVARLAGPTEYGLLMLATASVGFITEFISVRMEESVVKFAVEAVEHAQQRRAQTILGIGYVVNALIILATFAALFFGAPFIAERFRVDRPEEIAALIRILAFIPLAKIANGTSKTALRIFGRFGFLAIYRATKGILNLALPLALYFASGRELLGIAWGFVASSVATTILVQTAAIVELRRRFDSFRPAPWKPELRRVLSFLLHTNLSGYLKSVNRYFDVLLLGVFAPAFVVGYYKLALSVVSVLGIIAQPVAFVVYPTFSRLVASGKTAEIRRMISKASLAMAGLTIPAALLLGAFARPVLAQFADDGRFEPAAGALYILLFLVSVTNVAIWIRPAALALGKPEYSTVGNVVTTVLLVGLCMLLLPAVAVESRHIAAASALAASQLSGILLILFLLSRHQGLFAPVGASSALGGKEHRGAQL